MNKNMPYTTLILYLVSLFSYCALADATKYEQENWHIIPSATATSTPIFIEKSKDPAFGKQRQRKKRAIEISSERSAQAETATSTPVFKNASVESKLDDTHTPAPREFDVSVINNTCDDQVAISASFVICNEELDSLLVRRMLPDPFAKPIFPLLPATIKADTCIKFGVAGNPGRHFDCSGIYALSFEAELEKSGGKGYFGAAIVK